jgi:signal transduction histidine kinase/ActR/RegA family two-component response regulator
VNTPPPEVLARYEILDLDDRPFDVESLPARRVFAGHEGGSAVLHIRELATRREWWILLRASAVIGPDGKPEFAINIWHDVTFERRQERQAQYLAEATVSLGRSLRMDDMLSLLAGKLVPWLGDWCSIYVLDGERLTDVAVAHADESKQAVANEYRQRFPPDPAHADGVWGVIRSGSAEVFNGITDETLTRSTVDPEALRLLRSLGMRATLIAPMRIHDRVLGAIALVSAQKERHYDAADVQLLEEVGRRAGVALENAQLYKAAQEAARRAEEASRAKDEFLATLSHELRTPLSSILGWSSLLKDRVKDASLVKPVEVIHRNAVAQIKIIEDILDVSRVIAGNFRIEVKPTDVVAITREAIDVVRPAAAAKKLSIDFVPSHDFCLMIADPERLQQIVWNLLSNAVKFTDEGTIRVTVGREGSKAVISVRDTGRGIEPAFLPHVFERFRQADSTSTRRVGGLGLGLALVRHMVELHGGRVVAESEGLGKGSTFTITLPVGSTIPPLDGPEPPRAETSTAEGQSLRGVSVLVVDDETDSRDRLAEVLQGAGAAVETAASAAEAYERFRRAPPDVLVSDVGMPEEDGNSLVRRIRALPVSEGARVPALALSAFSRGEDSLSALAAGFTTHVSKPVDTETLVAAVAKLASAKS